MNLTLLAILFLAIIASAYFLYGKWVASQFELDNDRATPAHRFNDGNDFLPTRPFYLFGQHFSAIAAAGPIVGPIAACLGFGWLPCLLWITLGVVFIGAVHDFTSLVASVRRNGCSIAEVCGDLMGKKAGLALMAFIWIALIYVIVAFADVTSNTFVGATREESWVPQGNFNPGGAVAAAAILYLTLSMLMGLTERFLKPPLWLTTVIFVPLSLVAVWYGTQISTLFVFPAKTWALLIMIYCAIGSVLPVWLLLQPRGYLGGFILMMALALGIVGVFWGPQSPAAYTIQQDMFKGFTPMTPAGTPVLLAGTSATNSLFPFLFVTIACGACSGFHGLVCSGTTSKQIDKEGHAHPVGYGAMLAEGFVAFIALVTVMMLSREFIMNEANGLLVKGIPNPGKIYGYGIGQFMSLIIGNDPARLGFAITFGAMAFSTFVFDTLDVCTRLGRYLIQELTGWKGAFGAAMATLATVVPAAIFLLAPAEGGGFQKFWTLFGASNQLLAALTLLSITVWLYQAKKRIAFTLIPMLFVLTITLWALIKLSIGSFIPAPGTERDIFSMINGVVSLVLVGLALYLVITGLRKLREAPAPGGTITHIGTSEEWAEPGMA